MDEVFEDFQTFPVRMKPLDDRRCLFSIDVTLKVVAKDRALATARLKSTIEWLRELSHYYDLIRQIELDTLECSAELTDPESIEISPWAQVVNFPSAPYWAPSSEYSDIPRNALSQFRAFREAELHMIRTDSVHEAVTALESLSLLLQRVYTDATQWKWILQALHSALQSFMVASLQGTSPVRVLAPLTKNQEKRLANGKSVERKLKPFLELYGCIKDEQMMGQYTVSNHFSPNSTQDDHVRELNRLRNEFVHFTPKSYIVDVWDLPALALDVIGIIGFLAFESENVPWHYDLYPKMRTRELLKSITRDIEQISDQYLDTVKAINSLL